MYKLLIKFLILIFTLSLTPSIVSASGDGDMAAVAGVTPISISQTKEWMEQPNTYLFDANTKEVRDKYGYIPGSTYVNVENWLSLLPSDKNARLIFYCLNRLCFTSSDAAVMAMENGYKNVYVMLDGVEKWIITGNPVERVPGTDSAIIKKILASDELTTEDIKDYKDNVHSQMIFGKIPSCRDCHGDSEVSSAGMMSFQKSSGKRQVNENCASCHTEVAKEFSVSVHSQQVNPGSNVPRCTDCHSIHVSNKFSIDGKNLNVRQLSDKKCGTCHAKEQLRYHDTFHGKAMILNSPGSAPSVAACFDCHGTHNVFEIKDPRSTLSKENRINTCAECHPDSNENFALGFIAHADHTDKSNYPNLYWTYVFMTGLLISVFGFFGIHTFMWSVRLIKARLDYPKEWKEAKEKRHHDKVKLERFTTFHKIQHFFLGASFLGLSFSGLPQKFYTADWAQTMIDIMGGPIMATKIHHISAIIMIVVFLSHILEIIYRAWLNRDGIKNPNTGKMEFGIFLRKLFGPDSLMPRWQDFTDIKDHFKWFIGQGPRPQFDRFTYWEKFDYLAVFWGMFIIGLSGLVLWFPTVFTEFLPGWMINLCTILHSDEALLATGFIFAVHFFNTHFRADRFPMDMVIFSGNLTEEEVKQERIYWYERLKQSGKFDKLIVKDDNFKSYSWFAKLIGYAMLITGLIFLFLIIYAFGNLLLS